MFLKEVYRYNKWLFLLIISFAIGQLFVNYKWGLVVSPFYNYGMFSEVTYVRKDLKINEIKINDKVLRGQDFQIQQWDKIFLPIEYYENVCTSNTLYYTDVQRLLAGINVRANEQQYLQQCSYKQFEKWYVKYLQRTINEKVDNVQIYSRLYNFNHSLKATSTTKELMQKCP